MLGREDDMTSGDQDPVTEHERELYELEQRMLAEELAERPRRREAFDIAERVIAEKVKQLRMERGWSQEDLAERMAALGFPMHQTTIAKLEANKRPIRVSEAFALARCFGLPFLALWYLPIPGEPRSLTNMGEDLKMEDDYIAHIEERLQDEIKQYAFHHERRMRLAHAMNEAAKRHAEG